MKNLEIFKQQISEDIQLIKDEFSYRKRYSEENYVFNHWILEKIYSLNEDSLIDNITDKTGDNEIDCFVHYEDAKELYIIQNKYYQESRLTTDKLGKFLSEPLAILNSGTYSNKELQNAFNKAIADSEYSIYLYLYSLEDEFSVTLKEMVKHYNSEHQPDITAGIFNLHDLYDLYYKSSSHGNQQSFKYSFKNIDMNRILDFSNDSGLINNKFNAKYLVVSVLDIYNLVQQAKKEDYNLFDENIREYLGSSRINKRIIETLKSNSERSNFFYYNNGITLACKPIVKVSNVDNMRDKSYHASHNRDITLSNPQIINGCQTVNAIYDVLENSEGIEDKYNKTFVLIKLLDFNSGDADTDNKLYRKIVECTNNQNAIKPSDFVKNEGYFERIQKELMERGVLLEVKRSDRNKFKEIDQEIRYKLLEKLRTFNGELELKDSIFSLEKMLLIYLSFIKDGQSSFTKKQDIFNVNSKEYYESVSKKLDLLLFDNMIRMYCLYIRAEKDKKAELKEENGKKFVPYYLFSFIGDFLDRNSENYIKKLNRFFEILYSYDENKFNQVYAYFLNLTHIYQKKYRKIKEIEYNNMIKSPISIEIFNEAKEEYEEYNPSETKVVKCLLKEVNLFDN